MSRYYAMEVCVTDHDPSNEEAIQTALEDIWPYDLISLNSEEGMLMAAESSLCGGESEQEFADGICKAVFVANESACKVSVTYYMIR